MFCFRIKLQYIWLLMVSFLLVLLQRFGGQNGKINHPLTDKLIHCRVQSRITTKTPANSVKFKVASCTFILKLAFMFSYPWCWRFLAHLRCMIKTWQSQTRTAGMTPALNYFIMQSLIYLFIFWRHRFLLCSQWWFLYINSNLVFKIPYRQCGCSHSQTNKHYRKCWQALPRPMLCTSPLALWQLRLTPALLPNPELDQWDGWKQKCHYFCWWSSHCANFETPLNLHSSLLCKHFQALTLTNKSSSYSAS